MDRNIIGIDIVAGLTPSGTVDKNANMYRNSQ